MDGNAVIVGRLPGVTRAGTPVEVAAVAPAPRRKRRRAPRLLGRIMLNVVFLAMICCVGVMLGPALAGYQRYVILTGSMTGTYNRGSIVYDKPVPTASLQVGDPITYSPPAGFTSQARVSHRIYSIHRGPDGVRVFKTKGDANKHPDIWNFTLTRPTQEEVKFHVPEVGYVFLMLSIKEFREVLVGVPVVILGLISLVKFWREAGVEAKRQKLAALGWRKLVDAGSGAVLEPVDTPASEQVAPRLDLGLRPAPARPDRRSSRRQRPVRARIDVTLPLRIRALTPLGAVGSARSPGDPAQSAPGTSMATLRLLVAHVTAV